MKKYLIYAAVLGVGYWAYNKYKSTPKTTVKIIK